MTLCRIFLGVVLAASAVSAEQTRSVWRPFSDDSPWNERIAPAAVADPGSTAMIADFASRGPLFVNVEDWSIPVYYVDAAKTPKYHVRDSRPGVYGAGFEFPRQIPIPDDAVASPPFAKESDNHLCIVDKARGLSWDMWLARRDASGQWSTGLGAVVDLNGTGVAAPWFAQKRHLDAHRSRAGGFPLIAGLILREEIAAGRIEHALAFAYDHCRTEFFVPPASTAQSSKSGAVDWRGIPMGGRIQLDPAWDVEHSGLSRSGKIIARALQEYGAYCCDYADGNVLYAENSPAAVRAWAGVLGKDELERVFTPEMIRKHFRVVAMGNLMPGQNLKVRPPYVLTFVVAGGSSPAAIDQLKRTITVHLPPGANAPTLAARWTTYPQAVRVTVGGRAVETGGGELPRAKSVELTFETQSGARATWRLLTAE